MSRICLFGNFTQPWCSEVHHARSLESLGHEVIRLQETTTSTNRLLTEATKANLFVWVHTHQVPTLGTLPMERVLAELRGQGIPSLSYHLDAFYALPDRWSEYRDTLYIRGLDWFFTADGPLADWLCANTGVKGRWLPPGVLGEECYLAEPGTDRFDVGFVGSVRYHPSWPHRPKLIAWLQNTYGDRFRLFGQDAGRVVRGAELNQVYADAKVVVGDSLCPEFTYQNYWSDRIPETLGRGGMLVHPKITGLEKDYTDGEHLVLYKYGDFRGLKRKIDRLLAHDDEREKIRRAGHEHVKAHHTYTHRWQHILTEVFGDSPPKARPIDRREEYRRIGIDRRVGTDRRVVPPSGVVPLRRGRLR